jgi:glucosamine--fructose-6-phosphate aminotransferase (isomerizing)
LPATKTYTASLAALALLSAHVAADDSLLAGIADLPAAIESMLNVSPSLADAAQRLGAAQRCACLARGINYPTALEAALKLKETCYLGAEPYSTADFMHGPFAIIEPGFPALLFAPPGKTQAAMVEMTHALAQRGAASVVVAGDAALLKLATMPIAAPVEVDERLSPITYIVAGQLFALHSAQARGLDPDAPRSLNKVTLTR